MKKEVFKLLGYFFFGLGVLGIFLPLLPTTPFVLLAAYFFSHSSEKAYQWLVSLPRFGDAIRHWSEGGTISVRAKALCALSITLVLVYINFFINFKVYVKAICTLCLVAVVTFILSRPSGKNR